MGNEMGNNNVSGVKEDDQNPTVEAQHNSSREPDNGDDVKRENQVVSEGVSKDFHETGDSPMDEQTSYVKEEDDIGLKQSSQSPKLKGNGKDSTVEEHPNPTQEENNGDDVKRENQVLSEGESNDFDEKIEGLSSDGPSRAEDPPIDEQSTDVKEEDVIGLKQSTQAAEVPIKSNDEKETESCSEENLLETDVFRSEKQTPIRREGDEDELEENDTIYNTKSEAERTEERNMVETEATENLAESVVSETKVEEENIKDDSAINETESKGNLVVESIHKHRNEEAPSEINLGNGSSNSLEANIEDLKITDERLVHTKDCEVIGSISESEETEFLSIPIRFHEKIMNEMQIDDQHNASQHEEGKHLEELIEITPDIETVPIELPMEEHNREDDENKEELAESSTEERETTEKPISQTQEADFANILFSVSSGPQLNSEDQKQDIEIGSATFENMTTLPIDLKQGSDRELLVPESSVFKYENTGKQSTYSDHDFENRKSEQDVQNIVETKSITVAETETIEGRLSMGSIQDKPSANPELRKSPSFVFDLPLEPKFDESDQTPLLYHNKAAFRSLSSPTCQPISVEEKTIRVERSDSDKLKGTFLNFLKDEENGNFVGKSQKQDCQTPSKENALTKGTGKRRPRSSLFSTCICCAAAIN